MPTDFSPYPMPGLPNMTQAISISLIGFLLLSALHAGVASERNILGSTCRLIPCEGSKIADPSRSDFASQGAKDCFDDRLHLFGRSGLWTLSWYATSVWTEDLRAHRLTVKIVI